MKHTLAAAAALSLAAAVVAGASPATAQEDATVSVLHAVPGLTVDVYANGDRLLDGFEPGTLTDPLSLPAGSYDLEVFAAGDNPDNAEPAIQADNVQVPAGANATVVAHLNGNGQPALTPFVNDTSAVAAGQSRLVVRHTAAAPAVDVLADGEALFTDLTNPDEAASDVPAGGYSAAVALAGETEPVIGPADLDLAEGTSTIVYAWGSAEDGNLDLAVQTIDGLHSSPSGVPGGETGAAASAGAPQWALGLGLASLLVVGVAARRLAPTVTRS